MESELLEIINNELDKLNLNYEYMEYTGPLVYPYITGEYNEIGYTYEDNKTKGEFILTLWNRGKEIDLINIKEQIKKVFADYRTVTNSGSIFISYRNKIPVRSGEAELKKMEVYLDTELMEGEE